MREKLPLVIVVIFGTTGELIKLMPVLARLARRGQPFLLVSTGQQVTQIPRLLELAGLPPVDIWLAHGAAGHDLRTNRDIPRWAATVASRYLRNYGLLRRRLREGGAGSLVLVHGDTMTTVYGALLGRALRAPVAHIESGLRSFDLLHPFPEELNRRLTARIATICYAPGAWAASNLRRGQVVDTGSNTIRDALAMVDPQTAIPLELPSEPFGIVSLHRYELLNDRRLLAQALEALAASDWPLLFVDHPVTVAAVKRFGLGSHFADRLRPIPRLDFFGFVATMRRSSFLVTDSGGSQEETYYLDLPCLVHRKRTERPEGLGETAVVSGYDIDVLQSFLEAPGGFRRHSELPSNSPSDVIIEDLAARLGF